MQSYIPPIHKAVLIGSPGHGNDRLRGVENDLVNMRRFLLSANGGAWKPNEITVLADPTLDKVLNVIRSSPSDYKLVYFQDMVL